MSYAAFVHSIAASPLFDHHSGLGQAVEYFSIKAFLPESVVKTFPTAVLPRLEYSGPKRTPIPFESGHPLG